MRTKFKQWAVDYLNESPNIFKLEDIDSIKAFLNEKACFLEIGPGKGKFILGMAEKFPNYNFLVVEISPTIAGICLKKIDENKEINNVKMVADDFFKLSSLLDKDTFDGIFLNFSDPWPKKRHEKRRLTSKLFLESYKNILKPDGKIYFKTDNDDFFTYSRESFIENSFKIIYENLEYQVDASVDEETEFEEKFKSQNIKIKKLILTK